MNWGFCRTRMSYVIMTAWISSIGLETPFRHFLGSYPFPFRYFFLDELSPITDGEKKKFHNYYVFFPILLLSFRLLKTILKLLSTFSHFAAFFRKTLLRKVFFSHSRKNTWCPYQNNFLRSLVSCFFAFLRNFRSLSTNFHGKEKVLASTCLKVP